VLLETVHGAKVLPGLRRALAKKTVIGVLPERDPERYLAMLRPDTPVEYDDAAVIVSTSGSTGTPKGVVLSAAAIQAAVEATHTRLGGEGSWVCALPTHNVAGLMTLARGIIGGMGVQFCRADLSDLPDPNARSYLSVVPAQLHRALADAVLLGKLARYAAILVGGQALPDGLLASAQQLGLPLVTTYGMSETCGGCVYDQLPLDGVMVRIEPERDRIVLNGPMAFSGYRLQPGLTGEVLTGQTVRTPDRGQLDDGRLRVLGRLDDVVISGGVNVDLAEVQRRCDELWGVDEAQRVLVFDIPDPRWGSKIVAMTRGDLGWSELRVALSPFLDPAAIPKQLRPLVGVQPAQPGKINRTALREAWVRVTEGDDGDSG
jgi:O-succinylbenzoic acid--CoA ligase